jgi:hypothetical protein
MSIEDEARKSEGELFENVFRVIGVGEIPGIPVI